MVTQMEGGTTVEPSWAVVRAVAELREQLASSKRRLGLFLGAGTSMALGFPGVAALTSEVAETLDDNHKQHYKRFLIEGAENVEDVLSQVRLCRELIGESAIRPIDNLDAEVARTLDRAICDAIFARVSGEPPAGDEPARVLAHWLARTHRHRDRPVEIFTTNYDLVLERAMEAAGVPFFDGFVGSVAPFFVPESVDPAGDAEPEVSPPRSWTRLWKLHGSIGWRLASIGGENRIARVGQADSSAGELMIFPSREKYSESRRLPFITLQDRLRRFLGSGEVLLLIMGYSFSDQHLNDILMQGLRSNGRLAIIALSHGEADGAQLITPEKLLQLSRQHRNLTVLGPDKASFGGIARPWSIGTPSHESKLFWDYDTSQFTLGDFTAFASWIEEYALGRPLDVDVAATESADSTAT